MRTVLTTQSIMPVYLPAEARSWRRILMSSKGTTTKASVAPAEAPVRIESGCVIWAVEKMLSQNLPHASFAANLVALER